MREAQTMRQQLHPNVLPLYTSFVHEQNLWMVMPYVSSGSVLNIMKYAHPEVRSLHTTATLLSPARCSSPLCLGSCMAQSLKVFHALRCLYAKPCRQEALRLRRAGVLQGLEEAVIATILKEVLKGLDYMHKNGNIHRDVKASHLFPDDSLQHRPSVSSSRNCNAGLQCLIIQSAAPALLLAGVE